MTINLMIVDDSSVVRALTSKELASDPNIKIVATACDGEEAIRHAKKHQPDVIILDIEMPVMDGISALPKILEAAPKAKIIMASRLTHNGAETTIKALELGAVDYIPKPTIDVLDQYYEELRRKVLSFEPLVITPIALPPAPEPVKTSIDNKAGSKVTALAIASSTGGPQALFKVFEGLADHLSHIPIFITQHMPATFTTVFAEHLGQIGKMPSHEGKNYEVVKAGQIYLAPGNYHMIAEKQGSEVIIRTNQDPHVNFCRPAADPMFKSLSNIYGSGLLAVVLTGMGSDGADGAQTIANNGGAVIAQDAESSVIYGMPRAVAERGICQNVLPLSKIAAEIIRRCK